MVANAKRISKMHIELSQAHLADAYRIPAHQAVHDLDCVALADHVCLSFRLFHVRTPAGHTTLQRSLRSAAMGAFVGRGCHDVELPSGKRVKLTHANDSGGFGS